MQYIPPHALGRNVLQHTYWACYNRPLSHASIGMLIAVRTASGVHPVTGSPIDFCTECSLLYCIYCSVHNCMLHLSDTMIKYTRLHLHIQHKNDREHMHQCKARLVRIFTLYAAMDQQNIPIVVLTARHSFSKPVWSSRSIAP